MRSGYYWAVLFGETMIVQVFSPIDGYDGELVVKTFEYGYQEIETVDFISKEPLTI